MDQQIRPKLVVESADRALSFYEQALGAELGERSEMDGRVVFAEFRALGTTLEIKDADAYDGATVGLVLDVVTEQPDALWESLVNAGAEVVFALEDQHYGRRAGRVRDPFGVQWIVSGPPQRG
ncbi:MAG TPA: glyoxalase/bleomycin resistance/extradiol dioxygenase family protein [Nocardioides sp.]|nr:glyoxalase/bleomycin resistance/extradiol dioxygenase family protein [Nocardioides sp.]